MGFIMPLKIIKGDITKLKVDAVVNAANNSLLGGGGVDGAIHRAAGAGLLEECRALSGCETGGAKITKGYNLPAKHVIHTVGPIWRGGGYGEEGYLKSCYNKSLELARERRLESVAFPLISAGAYGYPKAQALNIAMSSIGDFLLEYDMTVYLVIYDKSLFEISPELLSALDGYIERNYFDMEADAETTGEFDENSSLDFCVGSPSEIRLPQKRRDYDAYNNVFFNKAAPCLSYAEEPDDASFLQNRTKDRSLTDVINQLDETFSRSLLRLIDEKGKTDAEVYRKANIDRRLFSKIRSNQDYRPSKATVIALAVALELNLDETGDLLKKAGFALSHSNKFDVIVEYFIVERVYNIFEINEALFAYDQNLLGA
jgi:O-acetyl-ADP-ribose deacetylase (regulator of RNase III)